MATKKKNISTDEPSSDQEAPKKKATKKAVKKPGLSKKQRRFLKILEASGYAQTIKTMMDKIRFKVCDKENVSIEYAHHKTINSLLKRKLIYKATDGKYYSFKSTTPDESKPMPISDGAIKQPELKLRGKGTYRKDSVKPEAVPGPAIKK